MLPMPGSPASSWALYRARLAAMFEGADARVCVAFWLLGLINNVLYVIILSAALDLVGPRPKGIVLLADVIPSFLAKLLAPYFIHSIPYQVRVLAFAALSTTGMLVIALTPTSLDDGVVGAKMAGVVLASLSSGFGELSFLGLTHFYGHFSLAAWGSGTGGAGLIGAGAYALATNAVGLSSRTSLFAFSFLPVIMLASFFLVLPLEPIKDARKMQREYGPTDSDDNGTERDIADENPNHESEALLGSAAHPSAERSFSSVSQRPSSVWKSFQMNLARARSLFFPYMLPLLLVYVGEYTINQGVAPTLLFPLSTTPFREFREFYPTYNAIYQIGVFLSRSSTPFFRVHNLYLPSFLQIANLIILVLQALFNFLPSVYIIFLFIFWEGLLGGLVYVNTFAEITDNVAKEDREFSLGATSVSDSGGICLAGFIGMVFEVWLCNYQVHHGRDYCRRS